MTTLEINTLLKKTSPLQTCVYGGLCQKQITQIIKRTFGNTDPDHRMRQHWIAIYIDANSRGEYYDPTGRPPHESAYVNFMNKHCLHWTYNTVRVQEEGSTVCELHSNFYLIHRCAGHSMTDVTRLLENPVEAMSIVQKFVLLLAKHEL